MSGDRVPSGTDQLLSVALSCPQKCTSRDKFGTKFRVTISACRASPEARRPSADSASPGTALVGDRRQDRVEWVDAMPPVESPERLVRSALAEDPLIKVEYRPLTSSWAQRSVAQNLPRPLPGGVDRDLEAGSSRSSPVRRSSTTLWTRLSIERSGCMTQNGMSSSSCRVWNGDLHGGVADILALSPRGDSMKSNSRSCPPESTNVTTPVSGVRSLARGSFTFASSSFPARWAIVLAPSKSMSFVATTGSWSPGLLRYSAQNATAWPPTRTTRRSLTSGSSWPRMRSSSPRGRGGCSAMLA